MKIEDAKTIKERMLKNAPEDLDKREGSIIYDSLSAVAIELELINNAIKWTFENSFADTAERPFLISRALERGIAPKPATYAVVKAEFISDGTEIPIGTRLSSDDINYKVTENLKNGQYLMQAETPGKIGNKSNGDLIFIDYIQGIKSGKILELTIPAVDVETTEDFRKDYFDTFNNQAYGGNIADYKKLTKSIPGVGGVKVYPVWNGGGTVKVVFTTVEADKPTTEFIKKVQEILDPVPLHQKGIGKAPIGHEVTVEGVVKKALNISFKITLKKDVILEQVKEKIEKTIKNYFIELNKAWDENQVANGSEFSDGGITVRISYIESRVLDINEVEDVEETKINGIAKNFILNANELAALGGVIYGN